MRARAGTCAGCAPASLHPPGCNIGATRKLQLSKLQFLNEEATNQYSEEMSSIIRISDGFSSEFLGSFSHSQKFHRVRFFHKN